MCSLARHIEIQARCASHDLVSSHNNALAISSKVERGTTRHSFDGISALRRDSSPAVQVTGLAGHSLNWSLNAFTAHMSEWTELVLTSNRESTIATQVPVTHCMSF